MHHNGARYPPVANLNACVRRSGPRGPDRLDRLHRGQRRDGRQRRQWRQRRPQAGRRRRRYRRLRGQGRPRNRDPHVPVGRADQPLDAHPAHRAAPRPRADVHEAPVAAGGNPATRPAAGDCPTRPAAAARPARPAAAAVTTDRVGNLPGGAPPVALERRPVAWPCAYNASAGAGGHGGRRRPPIHGRHRGRWACRRAGAGRRSRHTRRGKCGRDGAHRRGRLQRRWSGLRGHGGPSLVGRRVKRLDQRFHRCRRDGGSDTQVGAVAAGLIHPRPWLAIRRRRGGRYCCC